MSGQVFESEQQPGGLPMKTILIVEDSPFISRTISAALEIDGHVTHVVTTPDVALSLYHNHPRPDLMILDNHLGDGMMPGLEILDHLDHKVPVIMHCTNEYVREDAVTKGVEFVPKSAGVAGLMSKIQQIFSKSSTN